MRVWDVLGRDHVYGNTSLEHGNARMGVAKGATLWAVFAGVWNRGGMYLSNILSNEDGVGKMLCLRGRVRRGARICTERTTRVALRDDFLGLFDVFLEYWRADDGAVYAGLGRACGGVCAASVSVD